jgi:hypothetical protein
MVWTSHGIVGQMLPVFETKRLTPRQGSEHSLSSFNVTSAFLRVELIPLTAAECLMADSQILMSFIHLFFISMYFIQHRNKASLQMMK